MEESTPWQQSLEEANVSGQLVAVVDDSFELLGASDAAQERFGWTPDDVIGESVARLLHPDDVPRALGAFSETVQFDGLRPPDVYRLATKSNGFRPFDVIGETLRDPPGTVLFRLRELDDWARSEQLARQQLELIEMVAAGAGIDLCLDKLATMCEANSPNSLVVGTVTSGINHGRVFSSEECPDWLVERRKLLMTSTEACNLVEAQRRGLSIFENKLDAIDHWASVRDDLNEAGLQSVITTPIVTSSGGTLGFLEVLRRSPDPPDSREFSILDLLGHIGGTILTYAEDGSTTPEVNCSPLSSPAVWELLENCHNDLDHYAIVLIELADAAWIVNQYGSTICTRISEDVKRALTEAPIPGIRVVRDDSSRHAVLVPIADETEVQGIGQSLHTVAQQATRTSGELGFRPSLAVGLAASLYRGEPVEGCLSRAHLALRDGQRTNTSTPQFREQAAPDQITAERVLAELPIAIDTGQLQLVYQPIISTDTFAVIGVECLLRWNHPILGSLEAKEFIKKAQDSEEVARATDLWTIKHAKIQAEHWGTNRSPENGLTVWVNMSPSTLLDGELTAQLQQQGDGSHCVVGIELTPIPVIENIDGLARQVDRVRDCGHPVAIDAFGGGPGDLARFAALDCSHLKLSPALTHRLDTSSPKTAAIVHAVAQIADQLNTEIIATGIESRMQLASVHRYGYRAAQGRLVAPPLAAQTLQQSFGRGLEQRWLGEVS